VQINAVPTSPPALPSDSRIANTPNSNIRNYLRSAQPPTQPTRVSTRLAQKAQAFAAEEHPITANPNHRQFANSLDAMALSLRSGPTPLPHAEERLNLDCDGKPLTYKTAINGPDRTSYQQAECEEFDRLFETGTMRPIHHANIPTDRRGDVTYYNPVPKEKMVNGIKTFRIRGTVGGDRINYVGDVSARTADMSVVKILLNAVVSENARWMTIDIKDFYLGTPLTRPEYMRIPLSKIPPATLTSHALDQYVHNNAILFEINKGMYGLPQAGILANKQLVAHLAEYDFVQCANTPCLFRHTSRPIAFTLVVDDFGIKLTSDDDAKFLIDVLEKKYVIKVDYDGKKYLGFTIRYDKNLREIGLSMPKYIPKALLRFCPDRKSGAASPAVYVPPKYGQRDQFEQVDNTEPLDAAGKLRLQEIVGTFLFYARAVDLTMLPATNAISSVQAHPTIQVLAAADRLLAYAAAYPSNELIFHASDMTLHTQSDASYLSRSASRSVAGGITYLGNTNAPTHINGAIDAFSTIIPVVVSSAAEAEYAALFMNGQKSATHRITLEDLGYPQGTSLILADNACAVGIGKDTVKSKRTKCMDMRFHWIRDRIRQGQFDVQWRQGAHNLADFFTKPLPVHAHQSIMHLLVHTPPQIGSSCLNTRQQRTNTWKSNRHTNHTS
jgi:hypothetical protein